MPLENLIDLRLMVMQPSEAPATANILKKAHSSWSEVSAEFYDTHILPGFAAALQESFAIVGRVNGAIRAAYEPPNFAVEGDTVIFGKTKSQGIWQTSYSGADDYFAAEPERRGYGSAFFLAFARTLDQLASELCQPVVHRIQATHRSKNFFERLGYNEIHSSRGLQFDYHLVERRHLPVTHILSDSEREVVAALRSKALEANKQFK